MSYSTFVLIRPDNSGARIVISEVKLLYSMVLFHVQCYIVLFH